MTLLANRRARRPDGGASLAGWTTVQRTVWVSQAALLLLLAPCCHCCPLHPPPLTASLLPSASSTTAGTSSTKAGLAPSSHWPASGRPSCWRVAVHDNDSPRQSMTCCCVYGVGSAAALLIVLLLSSSRPPSRLCSAGAHRVDGEQAKVGQTPGWLQRSKASAANAEGGRGKNASRHATTMGQSITIYTCCHQHAASQLATRVQHLSINTLRKRKGRRCR